MQEKTRRIGKNVPNKAGQYAPSVLGRSRRCRRRYVYWGMNKFGLAILVACSGFVLNKCQCALLASETRKPSHSSAIRSMSRIAVSSSTIKICSVTSTIQWDIRAWLQRNYITNRWQLAIHWQLLDFDLLRILHVWNSCCLEFLLFRILIVLGIK